MSYHFLFSSDNDNSTNSRQPRQNHRSISPQYSKVSANKLARPRTKKRPIPALKVRRRPHRTAAMTLIWKKSRKDKAEVNGAGISSGEFSISSSPKSRGSNDPFQQQSQRPMKLNTTSETLSSVSSQRCQGITRSKFFVTAIVGFSGKRVAG
jgi:hypothetical protein